MSPLHFFGINSRSVTPVILIGRCLHLNAMEAFDFKYRNLTLCCFRWIRCVHGCLCLLKHATVLGSSCVEMLIHRSVLGTLLHHHLYLLLFSHPHCTWSIMPRAIPGEYRGTRAFAIHSLLLFIELSGGAASDLDILCCNMDMIGIVVLIAS